MEEITFPQSQHDSLFNSLDGNATLEEIFTNTFNPSSISTAADWYNLLKDTSAASFQTMFSTILNINDQTTIDNLNDLSDYTLRKLFNLNNSIGVKVDLSSFQSEGYSPILDLFAILCGNGDLGTTMASGGCDKFLKVKCKNYTRSQISESEEVMKFCGCYAPVPNVPNFNSSQYPPECDPMCNSIEVIKLYYTPNDQNVNPFSQKECQDAKVCVLDNININAVGNFGAGSIQLNQICPGCSDGTGKCLCVVDTTTGGVLDKINGLSSDKIIFNQFCPNSECINIDPTTGESSIVECGNSLAFDEIKNNPIPTKTILVIVGGLFVIFLLAILAHRYSRMHVRGDVYELG